MGQRPALPEDLHVRTVESREVCEAKGEGRHRVNPRSVEIDDVDLRLARWQLGLAGPGGSVRGLPRSEVPGTAVLGLAGLVPGLPRPALPGLAGSPAALGS